MKKFVFTLSMTFITLFLIWFLIMFIQHPTDFQYYHLDLGATFNLVYKLSDNSFINGDTLIKTINQFKDSVNSVINNGLLLNILRNTGAVGSDTSEIFNAVVSLISPISSIFTVITVLGYLIVLIIEFVFIAILVLVGLLQVLFNPVLIYYEPNIASQVVLEKAYNLFGVAFQVLPIIY